MGPTPRYQTIPRWGLVDRIGPVTPGAAGHPTNRSASPQAVRITLLVTAAVFAVAALAHVARYILLLINRTTLLHPVVAGISLLMGVMVSLATIVAVTAAAVAMTSWLIARRSEVFGRHGQPDPRPEWALWAGCLVPIANLVWAPVFVLELAHAEHSYPRLRGPVIVWWIGWIISTLISGWAIWTSGATDPQAVADNTETEIVAYLAGMAVVLLLLRVFDGFVHRSVAPRAQHRWVVVTESPGSGPGEPEESELEEAVESRDREPAA